MNCLAPTHIRSLLELNKIKNFHKDPFPSEGIFIFSKLKKFIYKNSVVLSVIWTLVILGLCSMPGQYIPMVSWLELLSFDKWVHAGIFFILCTLLFITTIKKGQSMNIVILYFMLAVSYGGLLEIMQAKVFSHRSADWQDFVANSFGCTVALIFLKKIRKMFSVL
jgi:hypothetical protein